jgi:hypothetical protein
MYIMYVYESHKVCSCIESDCMYVCMYVYTLCMYMEGSGRIF